MELASEPREGKILVIEPYGDARVLMIEILHHQFKCKVVASDSVAKGLHYLDSEDFDFIISESDEAGSAAMELMSALVKREMNIPLVFYSAYELPYYLFRQIDYPYTTINKPAHKHLLDLIHETIGWPLKGFASDLPNRKSF